MRVPSLSGKGKMSKSDAGDSYIAMDDDPDTVFRKVEKAFSDPSRIRKSIPGTPTREGCNVYHLHTFFSDGQTRTRIETLCREAAIGCVDCKRELAASMTKMTEPFRERKAKWSEQDVTDILALGKRKAQRRARQTVQEVRRAIGLVMV